MNAPVQNHPAPQRGGPALRSMRCREREIALGGEPLLVGIVNVTPDSFFDGGRFAAVDAAVAHGVRLVGEGAAMLDIGGQSTRPGYREISTEEEIARVVPVISALAQQVNVPLSIDTYQPAVAGAALEAGAHVVNDIHGFQRSGELATLTAQSGAAAILMHNEENFRDRPGDVMENIATFFRRSLELAAQAGVDAGRIILDPGIGFAKSHAQNLEILARLGELRALGFPLLLGASRKSVIGNVLTLPAEERLEGTLATTALAVWQGVEFLRVHDVGANLRAARMAAAIRRASALS